MTALRRPTWRQQAWRSVSAVVLWCGATAAQAETYELRPDSDLIGTVGTHTIAEDESLPALAVKYGLGYIELRAANVAIDPWLPPLGHRVVLPTRYILPDAPRQGIVMNLAELRLYYFPPGGKTVETYPIGIGREGWQTPLGRTSVTKKRKDPVWYVPESVRAEQPELPRAVGPGPFNPLGKHALNLGWPAYLIHGTNKPHGVGRQVSHGCVRMYPDDIAALFERVPVGTPVTVVDQPVKVGWHDGALYVEIHPSRDARDMLEAGEVRPAGVDEIADVLDLLTDRSDELNGRLNLGRAYQAARSRHGLPVRVSRHENY